METITIELRSRLRSCNIFISTRDILEKSSIQLKLNEAVISLRIGSQMKYLPLKSIKIIPKTLSSLTVTGNWISLRVQTQPIESAYGSLKTEIFSTSDSPDNPESKTNNLELHLKEKHCVLVCSGCKNELSKVLFFKRVLPLPTNNCDPSEWFCCNHDGDDYAKLLNPKESDCFYETDYQLLNQASLKKDLKSNEAITTITCNRCLTMFGTRSTFKESFKIWNCCVDYKFSDHSYDTYKASDPLKDFTLIISNKTDIYSGNRLLLKATDGNRSHYLLVQLMDKNLELLAEKDLHKSSVTDTIELTPSRVMKLLYRYAETEKEITSYCVDTERCEIALPVMLTAVTHLTSSTKRYPPSYRNIDEYYVGYIHL